MNAKSALYDISYINAIMYSSAMPMPFDGEDEEDAPVFDESKDMCNASNFEDFDEEQIVRQ